MPDRSRRHRGPGRFPGAWQQEDHTMNQTNTQVPPGLNVGTLREVSVVIESMTGLVRTTRAEAGTVDPELNALIDRALADLDAGVRRLHEVAGGAEG
jgi:hypothetical protein